MITISSLTNHLPVVLSFVHSSRRISPVTMSIDPSFSNETQSYCTAIFSASITVMTGADNFMLRNFNSEIAATHHFVVASVDDLFAKNASCPSPFKFNPQKKPFVVYNDPH